MVDQYSDIREHLQTFNVDYLGTSKMDIHVYMYHDYALSTRKKYDYGGNQNRVFFGFLSKAALKLAPTHFICCIYSKLITPTSLQTI